ncbi:MAG TPA: PAS domain S-box protein [Steroidobacteraceae bacterium]|nr:PAS domain S-box protein [Steroidobacteraceae bacterium]
MDLHSVAADTEGCIRAAAAAHAGLPAEFDGLARLARGIAHTGFASIVLSGSGASHSPRGAAAGAAPASLPADLLAQTLASDGACELADVGAAAGAIRGFAGWPLRNPQGEVLGALAVYDAAPLRLSATQRALLSELADQCVAAAERCARIAELELFEQGRPAEQRPAEARPARVPPAEAQQSPAVELAYQLLDNAPVAIYYVDDSRDINYCNPEYRRMFTLRSDQSPTEWAQGVHPEDRARIEETWNDFCARPRALTFEYRALQPDGMVRNLAEHVAPIAGGPGYVGTIADLTELVGARGELHKAEALFRNTFDQAPIGVAFADRQGRVQRFNQAFCALLGFSPQELAGAAMDDLTHPEEREECAARLERLWKGEVPFLDFEKRYRRRDGEFLWVRTTMALVRDGERAECSVEYLRDITQRKELAAQMVRQRTLLEAVIGDLPVALLACDVFGRITHFNRAAVELHCIQVDEPGTPGAQPQAADFFLMDGTLVAEEQRPLARALRGQTISNLELTVVAHDATPRTTLSSARRLVGPEGQTLGAVAVIQDTTERTFREMELERVNKELITASREAGMAEVATNVLHNVGNILNSVNISASLVAERLRQSKAASISRLASLLLEQGERAGQFLTDDPRGKRVPEYLAALGEQLMSDQRAALEELTLLRDNLEHIKDTVSMQQSYAKLCGVTETVQAVDLVEDSLRLNAGAFARHGVTLRREFGDVPALNVDKHKVLQILVNLVRNAKYACDDSGRPDKLITLRIEAAPRGVRISVIDNGIGIPPENMGKLFQHGFTTRASGHGFGLHSGALAAQELGGTLRAESGGAGLGAAFILELPLEPPKTARG